METAHKIKKIQRKTHDKGAVCSSSHTPKSKISRLVSRTVLEVKTQRSGRARPSSCGGLL